MSYLTLFKNSGQPASKEYELKIIAGQELPEHYFEKLKNIYRALNDDSLDDYANWYKENQRKQEATRYFLENDKEVVSAVFVNTDSSGDEYLYLVNVATIKDEQGKGHATRLFKQIKKDYKGYTIGLDVKPKNEPAIKLYEKMGFNCSMLYMILEN